MLGELQTSGSPLADKTFNLGHLLVAADLRNYFFYSGSLTTPTCNEQVKWIVFKDPVYISNAQGGRRRSLGLIPVAEN